MTTFIRAQKSVEYVPRLFLVKFSLTEGSIYRPDFAPSFAAQMSDLLGACCSAVLAFEVGYLAVSD